jgi:hypothetical protein
VFHNGLDAVMRRFLLEGHLLSKDNTTDINLYSPRCTHSQLTTHDSPQASKKTPARLQSCPFSASPPHILQRQMLAPVCGMPNNAAAVGSTQLQPTPDAAPVWGQHLNPKPAHTLLSSSPASTVAAAHGCGEAAEQAPGLITTAHATGACSTITRPSTMPTRRPAVRIT